MVELGRVQIDRLIIENFRSIQHCDVTLGPLTFLIGRNGSGKSSFLDALQFIQSALKEGVSAAIAERNGLTTILYRPAAFPATMRFKVCFSGDRGFGGYLELKVQVLSWTESSVILEQCEIYRNEIDAVGYKLERGSLSGTLLNAPPPPQELLYLSAVSGFEQFRSVYRLLCDLVQSEYSPKGLHLLLLNRFPKAYRFPSLVSNLVRGDLDRRRVVEDYLRLIVPNFVRLEVETAGDREWVAFVEKFETTETKFFVTQVSDGTLYATRLLLDLFVQGLDAGLSVPLLIEEPGGSLHPWATGILRSAIVEASNDRQIIVTTHSPDLLDDPTIRPENIRAVYRDSSGTHVTNLGHGAVALLNEAGCTAGELFRRGALTTDDEPEYSPLLA